MADRSRRNGFTSAAAEGCVILDGAGVALTMNPERALGIADEMTDAAAEAVGQRKMDEIGRGLKPT